MITLRRGQCIAGIALLVGMASNVKASEQDWLGLIPITQPASVEFERSATDLSPAIATVITRSEIEVQGYDSVMDALLTVPGLHTGVSGLSVRGFTTAQNAHVLGMLNGRPRKRALVGSVIGDFGHIPIDSVERIEVVRGPGTAMYGIDAITATVNVVTRATGKNGKLGLYGGSGENGLYARAVSQGRAGQWTTEISAQESDGYNEFVAGDLQSLIDPLLPRPASLAPGFANHAIDQGSLGMQWESETTLASARLSGVRNGGLGVGLLPILDPKGEFEKDLFDVAVERTLFTSATSSVIARASLNRNRVAGEEIRIFPPGAFGVFADGVKFSLDFDDDYAEAGLRLSYSGINNHQITVDLSASEQRIEVGRFDRNYLVVPGTGFVPGNPGPLAETRFERGSASIRLQDEVRLGSNWYLTAGASVDKLSKTGTIVSPRLALIGNPRLGVSWKLLYGRGLRQPSILETEPGLSLPIVVANPDLEPERLESVDVGASWQVSEGTLYTNAYYHQTIDQINATDAGVLGFAPLNTGTQYGHGVEVEYHRGYGEGSLGVFAAYQRNQVGGVKVGFAPRSKLGIVWNHGLSEDWTLGVRTMLTGRSDRPPDDNKPATHSYARTDFNLQWSRPGSRVSSALRITNAFNDQTPEANFHAASPLDRGLPGRAFSLSVDVDF